MRIFYKEIFENIKVFKSDELTLKEAIYKFLDLKKIDAYQIYEIVQNDFKEFDLKKINQKIENDIFIQLLPFGPYVEPERKRSTVHNVADVTKFGAGGAATGAAVGALVGSIFPGVGTLIGAAIGAGVGAIAGLVVGGIYAKMKSDAEAERYENQRRLNAEKYLFDVNQRIQNTDTTLSRVKSKALDQVLSSNKVSPNAIIPEIFGTFRFRPYQLSDLQRSGTDVQSVYRYYSTYSCGEGGMEISSPYFGSKRAERSLYTIPYFTFFKGLSSNTNEDLSDDGYLSGNHFLSINDFDTTNYTTPEATRDISGTRATLRKKYYCNNIYLDMSFRIISSDDIPQVDSFKNLYYRKAKRNVNAGQITVASYAESGVSFTHYKGFNIVGDASGGFIYQNDRRNIIKYTVQGNSASLQKLTTTTTGLVSIFDPVNPGIDGTKTSGVIIGGGGNNSYFFLIYNISGNNINLTNIQLSGELNNISSPTILRNCSVAGDKSSGIVFGGTLPNGNYNTNFLKYTISNNRYTFTILTKSGVSLSTSDERIEVKGDATSGIIFEKSNKVIKYVVSGNTVTFSNLTITGSLYNNRTEIAVSGTKTDGIIFGGKIGTNFYNSFRRYQVTGNTIHYYWLSKVGSALSARAGARMVGNISSGVIYSGYSAINPVNLQPIMLEDIYKYSLSGNQITVTALSVGTQFLGYNSNTNKGAISGSPANLITSFKKVSGSKQYEIVYTGSKNLKKFYFVNFNLYGYESLVINNFNFGGVKINAIQNPDDTSEYIFSRIVLNGNPQRDEGLSNPYIRHDVTELRSIVTNSSETYISSYSESFLSNVKSVLIGGVSYFVGSIETVPESTQPLINSYFKLTLFTDRQKSIKAVSLFQTNEFVFNIQDKNDNGFYFCGVYGDGPNFSDGSNINNVLRLCIAQVTDCSFLKAYHGKKVYYRTKNAFFESIDEAEICGLKTQSLNTESLINENILFRFDNFTDFYLSLLANNPSGFTRTTSKINGATTPTGVVTGTPSAFKSTSDINSLLYVLICKIKNNVFVRNYNNYIFYKLKYVKSNSLISETNCSFTSRSETTPTETFDFPFTLNSQGSGSSLQYRSEDLTSISENKISSIAYFPNTYSNSNLRRRLVIRIYSNSFVGKTLSVSFLNQTQRTIVNVGSIGLYTVIHIQNLDLTNIDSTNYQINIRFTDGSFLFERKNSVAIDEIYFEGANSRIEFYKLVESNYVRQTNFDSKIFLQNSNTDVVLGGSNPANKVSSDIYAILSGKNGTKVYSKKKSFIDSIKRLTISTSVTPSLSLDIINYAGDTHTYTFDSKTLYYKEFYSDQAKNVKTINLQNTDYVNFIIEKNNKDTYLFSYENVVVTKIVESMVIENNQKRVKYDYSDSSKFLKESINKNPLPSFNLTKNGNKYTFTSNNDSLESKFIANNKLLILLQDSNNDFFKFLPSTSSIHRPSNAQISAFNSSTDYQSFNKLIYSSSSNAQVTGDFLSYTTSSSANNVLRMLIGYLRGCNFINSYNGIAIYYKYRESNQKLNLFNSRTVCGFTSRLREFACSKERTITDVIFLSTSGPIFYRIDPHSKKYSLENIRVEKTIRSTFASNLSIDQGTFLFPDRAIALERNGIINDDTVNELLVNREGGGILQLRIQNLIGRGSTKGFNLQISSKIFMNWLNISSGNLRSFITSNGYNNSSDAPLEISVRNTTRIISPGNWIAFPLVLKNYSEINSNISSDSSSEDKQTMTFDSIDSIQTSQINHYQNQNNRYTVRINDGYSSDIYDITNNKKGDYNFSKSENDTISTKKITLKPVKYRKTLNRLLLSDDYSGRTNKTVIDFYFSGATTNNSSNNPLNESNLFSLYAQSPASENHGINEIFKQRRTTDSFSIMSEIKNQFSIQDISNRYNDWTFFSSISSFMYGEAIMKETINSLVGTNEVIVSMSAYCFIMIKFNCNYYNSSSFCNSSQIVQNNGYKLNGVVQQSDFIRNILNNLHFNDGGNDQYLFLSGNGDTKFLPEDSWSGVNTDFYGFTEIGPNIDESTFIQRFRNYRPFMNIFSQKTANFDINFDLTKADGTSLFAKNPTTHDIEPIGDIDDSYDSVDLNRPIGSNLLPTTGRIRIDQEGYNSADEINKEYANDVLIKKPFSENVSESGKLFVYEGTKDLPIFLLRITGSDIANTAGTNLHSLFNRNFSFRTDQRGFYLWPKYSDLTNNINNFFLNFITGEFNSPDKNSKISNIELFRVPYETILKNTTVYWGFNFSRVYTNLVIGNFLHRMSLTSNKSTLPIKREGAISFELVVGPPIAPDPDDFKFPDSPIPPDPYRTIRAGITTEANASTRHDHVVRSGFRLETEKFEIEMAKWQGAVQRVKQRYNEKIQEYQEYVREFNVDLREMLEKVSNLTVLCKRYLIDTDGGDRFISSNPSYICLHLLYEYHSISGIPYPFDSFVDVESFNDWSKFCKSNNFEFNAVVDFETSIYNLLQTIAVVARARIISINGKIKVIYDKKQTVPKQYISADNLISFETRIDNQKIPDAINTHFFDEDNLYRLNERQKDINRSSFFASKDILNINLFGVTSKSQIDKSIDYYIRTIQNRTAIYTVQVGVEFLLAEIGDLIAINYNEINKNMFNAKFVKVLKNSDQKIVGFITDHNFVPSEIDLSSTFSMKVFANKGSTIRDYDIQSFSLVDHTPTRYDEIPSRSDQFVIDRTTSALIKKEKKRLCLNLKSSDYMDQSSFNSLNIEDDNLILIGEKNNVTKYVTIKSISINQYLIATLTLIDYEPNRYEDLV